MKRPDTGQASEGGINKPRSFSETARGLLEWQRGKFAGKAFKFSDSEGKNEIKDSFDAEEGFEGDPQKMIKILGFLTSKMKIDDGGQLRAMLSELKGEGSLPTDKKSPPSDVLRKLLTGKYDEAIDISGISSRGQAYTLALYLYMHTSGDSEEEMTDTLEYLIVNYNDPSVNFDQYEINGLKAEPHLARMCSEFIKKHGLTNVIRGKFRDVLEKKKSSNDTMYERNVRSVMHFHRKNA